MKPEILRTARTIGLAVVGLWALVCVVIVTNGLGDRARPADVGIVPGSKVYPSGRPSPSLRARLDEALIVYRRGEVRTLFVSGGVGKEGFDESAVMRAYLVGHGVPANAIVTDSYGDNTFLTARHAAALMHAHGWTSAFVITQYFHVPRTRLALEKCGVKVAGWAHAPFFEWRDLYSVPREVICYPVYTLKRC